MPRNFDISGWRAFVRGANLRDPRVYVRLVLGALVLANLVVAAFTFHLFGRSAQEVSGELSSLRSSLLQQRNQLERTRLISGKVQKARGEGDQFLATYMTPRRTTYSTIVAELQQDATAAGLISKEVTFAPLDPVKGSEDLSMMTISAGFEGTYPNLLKFLNLLDRSQRFVIIDQLAASPQPNGKTLTVAVKVNTFVRDDTGGAI